MASTVADRQDYLLGRERLPRNEAAVFVETRLAAESPFVRNEGLDRIVTMEEDKKWAQISAELWKQADAEKAQIFDLMEKVQAKMQKKYGKSSQALAPDVRNATWHQVLKQVGNTAEQWSESRKASNISVCIDKIGRNSEAFQGWLQVLPSGDYGSSICGVFSIAVSAAGHYYKVEDAIFEALAEIPEILENAKRYVKIYSETRYSNLERKTFDLYLAILQALKHVLKFFADSSAKHFYEPLLKQSSYQQDLQVSLDGIRKQVERVKEEANQCSQARLQDIDQNLLLYGDLLQTVQDDSSQNGTVLQAIYRLLQVQCAQLSDFKEHHAMSASGTQRPGIEAMTASGGKPLNEPPSYAQAKRLIQLIWPDLPNSDDDEGGLAKRFLKETERDVNACLGRAVMMSLQAMSKIAVLMEQKEFMAFMDMGETTGSDYLLVNAHEVSEEGPSPLSFIGASLYRNATRLGSKGLFVLGYLCDEHRPFSKRGSETCKPVGMMLSLLGQLAAQMVERGVPVDLSSLDDPEWKKLKKHKLKCLGRVFGTLVRQLPLGSHVYCVVDEATWYEQPGMSDDLELVLSRLTRTVRVCKDRGDIEFKFLVTARGEARRIGPLFGGRIIDLPEAVEPRDSSQTVVESIGKAG